MTRLRRHAAVVRGLLAEIDRIVPFESEAHERALEAQLIDDLARLADRILAFATSMSRPEVPAPVSASLEEDVAHTVIPNDR